MQSPLGDVKKLRAARQIKPKVSVHGFELKRKLGAGVRVKATVLALGL